MPNVQGLVFFDCIVGDTRAYGWSESVWLPTANTLEDGMVKLNALTQKRISMLGAGVLVPYMRVSSQPIDQVGGIKGDSQISEPNFKLTTVPLSNQDPASRGPLFAKIYNPDLVKEAKAITDNDRDANSDFPYSALLLRAEAQDPDFTSRRQICIRGNPDFLQAISISKPESFPGFAVWNKAYNAWAALLVSQDYGILSLDRSAANPSAPIASVATTVVQPSFTITGLGATVGKKVRISGNVMLVSGGIKNKELNGIWTVETVAGDVYKFLGMEGYIGSTPLTLGTARIQKHVVKPFSKVQQRRWMEKRTGRAFDQPR